MINNHSNLLSLQLVESKFCPPSQQAKNILKQGNTSLWQTALVYYCHFFCLFNKYIYIF